MDANTSPPRSHATLCQHRTCEVDLALAEINVAEYASCFEDFSCCPAHWRYHISMIQVPDCVQPAPALNTPPLQRD